MNPEPLKDMELYKETASKLSLKLKNKEITSSEIIDSVFNRIDKAEDKVKAFVTILEQDAKKSAARIDMGSNALAGIPIAIKDNMCTKGVLTTCCSKILGNFIPVYDGTVVKKVNDAGMISVGKTNLDEFAMGSSTENSAIQVTSNPWDLSRVPGGSSGGAAASVSAGETILALGSDTGGSIRQPASLCGVVGLKPTYGLVSRYGLVAFASSLDQIGPITRDVTDSAMLLNIIAGYDPMDSTSINTEIPDYTKALTGDIKGMKIGIVSEFMGEGLDHKVKESVITAYKKLEEIGADVSEVSLSSIEYALPAYYIIAPSEASSNLARFDGVRYGYRSENNEDIIDMYKRTRGEGFGDEVKRRIMLGTYALSAGYYEAYYGQAQKVRSLILDDFNKAFEQFDVLVSPTSPTTAFKIGEKTEDPLQMYLSDAMTIPVNLAGIPAISVPCGFAEGLPVGLQIMGKHLDEITVLKAAYAYEQARGEFLLPEVI
jgi:aspartyl-tRNA(Asn)/glutamyl-tRNA(Gln) amidotransferase subunit A